MIYQNCCYPKTVALATRVFLLLILWSVSLFAQDVTLQSVTPARALVGSSAVPITLTGRGFVNGAVVLAANNQTLPTTFIDSTTLQSVIPANLLAVPARLFLNVMNPGSPGVGGTSFFVVTLDPAVINSVVLPAGGYPGTTVRVQLAGANLYGSTLSFSGSGLTAQPEVSDGTFNISIAPDAPLGPQTITVSTLAGSTTVCGQRLCTFSVVPAGSWTDVPSSMQSLALGPVVQLLDGRLLVLAGSTSVKTFDPATMQWTDTGSLNIPRAGGSASLLPDGRVLLVGGALVGGANASSYVSTAEIYDPSTGTWSMTGSTIGQPSRTLLMANGKVLASYDAMNSAELFDPTTGQFQLAPGIAFQGDGFNTTVLLSDGRVLIIGGQGLQNRIYDPATATLSVAPRMGNLNNQGRLLPDGRVLVRGISVFRLSVSAIPMLYDPQSNTVVPAALDAIFSDVLLPNGLVLINGDAQRPTELYDPATDQALVQPSATPSAGSLVLLEDGRVFGISYVLGSSGQINGSFAQIFTPPPYSNPAPHIASVLPNNAPTSAPLTLDIHGDAFLPNSSVYLGTTKLVTLYMGSHHLAAFVPPPLRSSLSSGVSVNNPAPDGGRTDPVRVGIIVSAPLPISEVESGTIRSGYIMVTPDAGMSTPLATLTYGMVHDAIVQSQAAILPTPLTSDSTLIVDVVSAIGRNLGLAIANPSGTNAAITLTLRDADGNVAGPPSQFSLQARTQIARFLTELFQPDVIGGAFRGSVAIQSSVPVSIIGLRFSGAEFSTVPISVGTPAPVPVQGSVGGVNAVMFPQFAMSGGWATTLGLVNTASNPTTGRIDIFDTSGNPMSISWNGEQKSTFTYNVSAHGSLVFAPRDSNGQSPF